MFSRSQRLPSQKIQAILHHGTRVRGNYLDLLYVPTHTLSRWTVIVSSSVDKRAVARNRMKRLVREAVQRLSSAITTNIDGVWMVRKKLPDAEVEVEQTVTSIFSKIGPNA